MEQPVKSPSSPAANQDGPRVLMASSEAHPLIKTGGLADVAASLPAALRQLGHDARLIMPAYPRAVRQLRDPKPRCELAVPGYPAGIRLLEGLHPDQDLPVYLVDAPDYFCREGNPYTDLSGHDWGDNAERFLLFCRVVALIAQGLPALGWRPDVLHGNDWQTGLAPALLKDLPERPATVFTIHNLAYQGLFDRATTSASGCPPRSGASRGWSSINACPSSRAASSSPTGSIPSARPMRRKSVPRASAAGSTGFCARSATASAASSTGSTIRSGIRRRTR